MSRAIGATIDSTPSERVYDLGRKGLPLDQRPGITLPTPENLQAVTDKADAHRQRETESRNSNPHDLGRAWGVTRDMVLFLQRLEATVIEQGKRIAELEAAARVAAVPPHLRGVERRA